MLGWWDIDQTKAKDTTLGALDGSTFLWVQSSDDDLNKNVVHTRGNAGDAFYWIVQGMMRQQCNK